MSLLRRLAAIAALVCGVALAHTASAQSFSDVVGANINGASSATATVPAGGEAIGTPVVIGLELDSSFTSAVDHFTDDQGNSYILDAQCYDTLLGGVRVAWYHSILSTALTAGQHWTFTAGGGSPFGQFWVMKASQTIYYVDGPGACTNAHSGGSSFPSGNVGGGNTDLVAGMVATKGAGNAFTQSTGFTTLTTSGTYGTVMRGYVSSASVQNYTPTGTQTVSTTSAAVAYSLNPPAFNRLGGGMLGLQPNQVNAYAKGGNGAPDIAVANNLTIQTFGAKWFDTKTIDQSAAYTGGFRLYYGNGLGQSGQPSNSTLNGANAAVGENSGGYQDTLDTFTPGSGGGSTYKGKAFGNAPGGQTYFEVTCSFTATSVGGTTWQACGWTYSAGCMTPTIFDNCQWPGQTAGYQMATEDDIMEMGMGSPNFTVTCCNDWFSTTHDHFDTSRATGTQDQHKSSPGSASFSSQHRYGLLWTASTETTDGSDKYYYDGTLIGTTTYSRWLHHLIAASALSTSSANFTTQIPQTQVITHGYVLVDNKAAGDCTAGTVATYNPATGVGTLAANSACTSDGSTDKFTFAPPIPPTLTSGTYNPPTGVITLTVGADPGYIVGLTNVQLGPNVTGTGSLGSLEGIPLPTLSGTTGTTVVLQGPTGLGTITITGESTARTGMIPPWAYGAQDDQHLDFMLGCMNSPNQCTVTNVQVWQSTDDYNIVSY